VFGISIIINEFCNTRLLLEQRENYKKIMRKQNEDFEKINCKVYELNTILMDMLFNEPKIEKTIKNAYPIRKSVSTITMVPD